jgi:hypothetical protein
MERTYVFGAEAGGCKQAAYVLISRRFAHPPLTFLLTLVPLLLTFSLFSSPWLTSVAPPPALISLPTLDDGIGTGSWGISLAGCHLPPFPGSQFSFFFALVPSLVILVRPGVTRFSDSCKANYKALTAISRERQNFKLERRNFKRSLDQPSKQEFS